VKRIALVETLTVDDSVVVNNPGPVQRYQLGNNIESATLELDENANIISYEEYYPYGDTSYQAGRSGTEVSQKRYRYTGKEKDDESGFYYHGARYYACWLGRWTAVDPAGLVDGVNLYMYCGNNPLRFIDPSGNEAIDYEISGRTSGGLLYIRRINNNDGAATTDSKNTAEPPQARSHVVFWDTHINELSLADNYHLYNSGTQAGRIEYHNIYRTLYGDLYENTLGNLSLVGFDQSPGITNETLIDNTAAAGLDILAEISNITGVEHSSAIVETGGRYRFAFLEPGTNEHVGLPTVNQEGVTVVGYIHTHVEGGMDTFSPQDILASYGLRVPIYFTHTTDLERRVFKFNPPNITDDINQELNRFIDNNDDVGLRNYLLGLSPKERIR
jgi:RHS repeat-associated protein